ncbi:DnaJ domain-containing protein [Fomitopsis serialis]|uniref:DnaJ domain-containing protein n=1 Tax=Fomitopsis serialis TaxID=139415 RepID=UPI002007734A|nr:DnaJ domain-containing protein [Neoantrodia serialis]KAH9937557.1 DnaJ domain-containing protein [Neoantrodia serialis]
MMWCSAFVQRPTCSPTMSSFPDYYKILAVSKNATQDEIRQAYKIQSLKTHPDRLTKASQAEKKAATEKFQAVADAYYMLSDATRRREQTSEPDASANFFSTFASMFGGGMPSAGAQSPPGAAGEQPDADHVFADVFDDLLRPEVQRHAPWFIIANIPGLMVGAYAGNRLGAIRDAKGKSVAAVFGQLGGSQKAEVRLLW